ALSMSATVLSITCAALLFAVRTIVRLATTLARRGTHVEARPRLCHAGRMANSSSGESVLERTVRILDTFTTERTVQTVAQIARRAELASSTAHRLVDSLVDTRLLQLDHARRVRLGLRLCEPALRGPEALRLRQAALPAMERAQARVRQHTQLAVYEQGEALFLERPSSP